MMIDHARWAARAYATYSKDAVDRIVAAVARTAADHATKYAEWAVRETGLGVVEHKVIKNLACSTGLPLEDYVSPRVDALGKIVSVPRPAGVVLALTPSTNPVATVSVKILLALMTRNAIVVSPHPLAKECCADAARLLGEAAVAAGAPDGVVQVVASPTIPLIESLMADVDLVLATGGPDVVRASYRSGTPALGVGPGNVPVLVDRTASVEDAAREIVDSKSFDHSILCTNESVLIVEDAVHDRLIASLARAGAHLVTDADLVRPGDGAGAAVERVRVAVGERGNIGQSAVSIAERAGLRVPPGTRVLLAPFDLVVPEEPLAREKLMPVLGLVRVASVAAGIRAARAVLRISGAGHSAAIHSADPAAVLKYGAAVPALRVVVNTGSSLGSAGITTGLAASMTIGTGYMGGSSVGENLTPGHLVNWTRVAYPADTPFPDSSAHDPWAAPQGATPPYPRASNSAGGPTTETALRGEIRRLILEELQALRGR